MLEGRARAEVGGEVCELGPGDCRFFPADLPYVFTVVSEAGQGAGIYSPPHEEHPARVRS